mgnify:FL=1
MLRLISNLVITSVREVIQVKRRNGTINRPVLDQLRGSLHRFRAMRGTIITIGKFASGAKIASMELGAAPITLIDGENLLEFLLEHEIGISKKSVDFLSLITANSFNLKNPWKMKIKSFSKVLTTLFEYPRCKYTGYSSS